MSIQNWSERIILAELSDDPAFTDDLNALTDEMSNRQDADVVLNFSAVTYLNSSNIAKLLKLRKDVLTAGRRLMLCAISTHVWGVFLVTGLDKIFEFHDDVATALAAMQISADQE